jgi:hypothetical protein
MHDRDEIATKLRALATDVAHHRVTDFSVRWSIGHPMTVSIVYDDRNDEIPSSASGTVPVPRWDRASDELRIIQEEEERNR